jgi:hypothetical protein
MVTVLRLKLEDLPDLATGREINDQPEPKAIPLPGLKDQPILHLHQVVVVADQAAAVAAAVVQDLLEVEAEAKFT